MKSRKVVFLDRDGVLNQAIVKEGKPYPPASLTELIIPDDVLPALNRLKKLGFLLVGITNQPDVARGTTSKNTVEAINNELLIRLPLERIYVCYHDNAHNCDCRKPQPGLLFTAADAYNVDLKQSFMIGDRWKDIVAGAQAGCKTLFIDYHYQEEFPAGICKPDFTSDSLAGCVDWIIKTQEE